MARPPSALAHEDRYVNRNRQFWFLALFLACWTMALIAISLGIAADLYYYSYYSVDYSAGFVRRGLAGELLNLFDPSQYFTGLRILRWIPTVLYVFALLAVAWTVAVRFGYSERRLMLAMLIPVLPFGFAFAFASGRPDVLSGAALAILAVALSSRSGERYLMITSAAYGLLTVPLTLIHEATPFLYGLGAVATILTLGRRCRLRIRQCSAVFALLPGLATAAAIVLFGRRGISQQLCERIPSEPVNNPLAGRPTLGQILSGFRYYVDYRDWFCRFILPYFDQTFGDAVRFVMSRGVLLLGSSVLFGILVFAVAMLAISHVSGVPVRQFCEILASGRLLILASAMLFLPVFLTGVDWTRWIVTMSFDLAIPYLFYASSQVASCEPLSRRAFTIYLTGVIFLALFPIGVIPGFAGTFPG